MKTTSTTIQKDHATLKKTFEYDNVLIMIAGVEFVALKESFNQEAKATIWGMGQGFDMMISFDIGDSGIVIKSKETFVFLKIADNWEKKRVEAIESHIGTVYKVTLKDEY